MKRILVIFISSICLSIYNQAVGQNIADVYLAPNPQTARWSYIETDNNGKQIATIYYSVESIEGNAMNGNLKLRVEEVPFASPKDTTRSFNFYCFKDGEFMVDICSGLEDNLFEGQLDSKIRNNINESHPELSEEKKRELFKEVRSQFFKISGETHGIPRYPKVGKLPDYEFYCKVSIISMRVRGEERNIIGKESIQTEAGMFDCFIMEETITTKSMMMKDVERIRSWYAYGIGLVKEMTYDKNGKLISTMILNKVNW